MCSQCAVVLFLSRSYYNRGFLHVTCASWQSSVLCNFQYNQEGMSLCLSGCMTEVLQTVTENYIFTAHKELYGELLAPWTYIDCLVPSLGVGSQ